MSPYPLRTEHPNFLTDSTLGKLAKWLRLAGLDTKLDRSKPSLLRLKQIADRDHRVILTRTKAISGKMRPHECLFIRFNNPMDQARQVMRHFQIRKKDLPTLSRCAICNHPLSPQSHDAMFGCVPAYIWQRHDQFMMCMQCSRIYWPGTHTLRTSAIIDQWFI
ncbi:MAG: Mut7-C RNAse domain-containing protein [Desulfobacteraceae bacterium]|jgi:uncharacterized protein with PIN domain